MIGTIAQEFSENDIYLMRRVLTLAKKGMGFVNPNPLVGCVITLDNKIVGEGFHEEYGGRHAEANAILNSKCNLEGASLYVNLEPCSHYGKQPPCCEAIVKAGIKKVFCSMLDPNPLVSGNGIKYLEEHGVEVNIGLLRDEAHELNKIFIKYMESKKTFVRLKSAMTVCGHIATKTSDSKWISSNESRINVHKDRNRFMSILTGIGTILKDDPYLNARVENSKNPTRLILDSNLRIPKDSKIVKTALEIETIIFHLREEDSSLSKMEFENKISILNKNNIKTIAVNGIKYEDVPGYKLNLKEVFDKIYELGIDSVYVECGGNLAYNLLNDGLIDEYEIYIGPKIVGGNNLYSPITGSGIEKMKDSINLNVKEIEKIGEDIRILYEVV